MNTGRTVFSQLMDFLPLREFRRCVERYKGNYYLKYFSCLDQFLCMAFAQLSYRESLRDIESCLRSMKNKLYHMGIRSKVSRSTLADANEKRDWRIYADFAQVLINIARDLYVDEEFGVELNEMVYALDASSIDLCLSLFPWAQHRRRKSAVKINTQLDLRGNIPAFIRVTGGQIHDVHFLDHIIFEAGAFYVMDKGYTDFQRLYHLHQQQAFFVIRAKSNLTFSRQASHPVIKKRGLRSDQTIRLTGPKSSRYYPERLRRIHYVDIELKRHFYFLTNNFNLSALTIARLYKLRWQVELFFKWIKQHLRIRAFYGTTPNAVKTQVWIAISVYVLVAILKKEHELEASMYEILQVLGVMLFEKTPVKSLFSNDLYSFSKSYSRNQLNLFNI